MTAPTIEQLPVRVPGRSLPPPLIHVSCLRCDPDLTFCGIDATAFQQISSEASGSCVVCVDIDKSHDWNHGRGQS